ADAARGRASRRHAGADARDRAEALGDPGQRPMDRPEAGRAHRRGAGRAGLQRRRGRAHHERRHGRMKSDDADRLIVQEVAPRDGLQIEPAWVETEDKVTLIDGLSEAGFTRIEAGSFVSPRAVPALRDGGDVFRRIGRRPGVTYVALVPNVKGA